MNESTCSSKFQSDLRIALPGSQVTKHADKSMIGHPDASITYGKKTLWAEYKFIGPDTKGVNAAFLHDGAWSPTVVADASPTQAALCRKLATAGHCIYLFWVLDAFAVRKKVGYVTLWHPITKVAIRLEDTAEAVFRICQFFQPDKSAIPALFNEFFRSV